MPNENPYQTTKMGAIIAFRIVGQNLYHKHTQICGKVFVCVLQFFEAQKVFRAPLAPKLSVLNKC